MSYMYVYRITILTRHISLLASFFSHSSSCDTQFDDPRLTDYETLMANLADLKAGRETQVCSLCWWL
jgi:hypothetical protein